MQQHFELRLVRIALFILNLIVVELKHWKRLNFWQMFKLVFYLVYDLNFCLLLSIY